MDSNDIDLAWMQEALRGHTECLVHFLTMPAELQDVLSPELVRRHLILGGELFTSTIIELNQLADELASIERSSLWSHPDIERFEASIEKRKTLINCKIASLKVQLANRPQEASDCKAAAESSRTRTIHSPRSS